MYLINTIGLPGKSELHQSAQTIEVSATPNEFHRVRDTSISVNL